MSIQKQTFLDGWLIIYIYVCIPAIPLTIIRMTISNIQF